jgi:2-polyprenyl-3-methyl-5-hydroxy-6-metoxy-1,4-benzoquinol methylase
LLPDNSTRPGDQVTASEQVRAFYERMPYPPPLDNLNEHRELYRNPLRRRALFHRIWPAAKPRRGQAILIAGCGTSQAARHAMQDPDAHVSAIDVSETSLRHTRALQRTHGLDNLEVHRLAIEDVAQLGRCFDLIVCTGVLHHLPDPDIGLRALHDVLHPHGALHLMVYAAYGRAGIYMMQEYCRLLGIGTSPEELRDLGATLDSLSPTHAIASVLRGAKDFRRPDMMADALLHPLDRAFTVPALYAWLERCGMSFGRWSEQAPYLAWCGAVAKSPHAARLASLSAPQQHAAVELFRGSMVTHSAIAYRDDRPAASQPIVFEDTRWRGLVPIPLPWTVRIRDRLPRGTAAVLINRAHTFPDLVLPIDSFEVTLLDAVDGERPLDEILHAAASDEVQERSGLDFFERLWRHDQVVFDASARGA